MSLNGVSFNSTSALKTAAGDSNYFIFHAINNTLNPYAAE